MGISLRVGFEASGGSKRRFFGQIVIILQVQPLRDPELKTSRKLQSGLDAGWQNNYLKGIPLDSFESDTGGIVFPVPKQSKGTQTVGKKQLTT